MVILFDTPLVAGFGVSCDCSEMGRGGASPWTVRKKKAIVSTKVYIDIICGGSSPGSAYKYGTFWMNQVKESWRARRSFWTISLPQSARCLEKCRLPFPEREEELELCAAIRSGRVHQVSAVVDGGMPCCGNQNSPIAGSMAVCQSLHLTKKSTPGT